jgi:hypothetical protein
MRYLWPVIIIALLIGGCRPKQEVVDYKNLPYPPDENILFYQAEADSGYQTFWTDIKATTSAYLNNSQYDTIEVAPEDIILVGQGLFRGTIEVEMPEFILTLKLERPNKSIGRKSIWQVISAEEKLWPNDGSKSKTSK